MVTAGWVHKLYGLFVYFTSFSLHVFRRGHAQACLHDRVVAFSCAALCACATLSATQILQPCTAACIMLPQACKPPHGWLRNP